MFIENKQLSFPVTRDDIPGKHRVPSRSAAASSSSSAAAAHRLRHPTTSEYI